MDEKIDVEKVKEWLNKQWRGPKLCPVCNSNSWGIGERAVEVREFHGGSLVVGGKIYPLITVTCGVCGYTLLFNAVVAELVKAEQEKATPLVETEQSKKSKKEEKQ